MVTGTPYPGLERNTTLYKATPGIPASAIIIRVSISIWEVTDKKDSLSSTLHIMIQSGKGIERLAKIACMFGLV